MSHDFVLEKQKIMELEKDIVDIQSLKIIDDFKLTVLDLFFFANYNTLENIVTNQAKDKSNLVEDLILFSRGSKLYDQIRLILSNGDEYIRINLSENSIPIHIKNKKLFNHIQI